MEELAGEFLKTHTWIFFILYWFFIIWVTRRAGVKMGIKGILIYGIIFMASLLMTLAHPVIEGFLLCGFVCLMNYVFQDHSRQ